MLEVEVLLEILVLIAVRQAQQVLVVVQDRLQIVRALCLAQLIVVVAEAVHVEPTMAAPSHLVMVDLVS
jgi:hypothetical protein|tara:strand:+ start:439 stop:645 length:207 start_codon:yes stop_codon:yes gene_type:complete